MTTPTLRAVLTLVAVGLTLGGCVPSVAMLALGGLGGGGSGGSSSGGTKTAMHAPSVASAPTDSSVAQALHTADQAAQRGVTPECAARLPPEPEGGPRCAMRPVCLPGAQVPVQMALCSMAETASAEAAPTARSPLHTPAAWDWQGTH